jgi:ribosomal protein L36
MRVRASIKKRCEKCKIIRSAGDLRIGTSNGRVKISVSPASTFRVTSGRYPLRYIYGTVRQSSRIVA